MSLEKHFEDVKSAMLADMEKNKEIIFNGLVSNAPVNTLPESIFVNYFLPFFLGKADKPSWVMEWVSVAGTPMAEVAIVKDGTNEIIFRVPGILSTNNMLFNKGSNVLADVFTRTSQLNNNMPGQGSNFLMNSLSNINKGILEDHSLAYAKDSWHHILIRYNLIPSSVSDTNLSDNSLSDCFEY